MLEGLSVTLIGISIVMAVLYALSLLLQLLKHMGAKTQPNLEVQQPVPEVVKSEPSGGTSNDLEITAVVTAALAAYLGTPADGLVVRSIRRVRPWIEAARKEQQRRL